MTDPTSPHSTPTAAPSDRSTIKRSAHHASYDRAAIDAILDAALVAHVGIVDGGQPFVLPCAFARCGDELLLHGSVASRLFRNAAATRNICVTVTLLDGMIVARSTFESSMRYRSVVVVGDARLITDHEEKRAALEALSEHLIPGRSVETRPMLDVEIRQTSVVALSLAEAAAKIGDGFSDDPDDDVALPIWAGVVPLEQHWGEPMAAPNLVDGVDVPASVEALRLR